MLFWPPPPETRNFRREARAPPSGGAGAAPGLYFGAQRRPHMQEQPHDAGPVRRRRAFAEQLPAHNPRGLKAAPAAFVAVAEAFAVHHGLVYRHKARVAGGGVAKRVLCAARLRQPLG